MIYAKLQNNVVSKLQMNPTKLAKLVKGPFISLETALCIVCSFLGYVTCPPLVPHHGRKSTKPAPSKQHLHTTKEN